MDGLYVPSSGIHLLFEWRPSPLARPWHELCCWWWWGGVGSKELVGSACLYWQVDSLNAIILFIGAGRHYI